MSSTQGIQAEAPTAAFGPVTGDIYQRQMGRWSQRLAEPFLDFVAASLHGAAALDVGCGTGSLSFAMARRDCANCASKERCRQALSRRVVILSEIAPFCPNAEVLVDLLRRQL